MVYCTVAYRGGLHRKITKNLWNMQMPDICEDIGHLSFDSDYNITLLVISEECGFTPAFFIPFEPHGILFVAI